MQPAQTHEQKKQVQLEIERLKRQFHQSADFEAKDIAWGTDETAILCYYSSLVQKSEVERYLNLLRLEHKRALTAEAKSGQDYTMMQLEGIPDPQQSDQNLYKLERDDVDRKSDKQEKVDSNKKDDNPSQAISNQNSDKPDKKAEYPMKRDSIEKLNNPKKTSQNEKDDNDDNSNQHDTKEKEDNSNQHDTKEKEDNSNQHDAKEKEDNSNPYDPDEEFNKPEKLNPISQTTVMPEDSITIATETYNPQKIVEYVCNGETIIILLQIKEIVRLISPEFAHRTTDEPESEQVLRGSHEGFVEHFDSNVSLVRKRIKTNKLVVKRIEIGTETKTFAYYFYVDDLVDRQALKTVEDRLNSMKLKMFYSLGQLNDQLDDEVLSPFPQLLHTERPDRVAANILEGKIAVMSEISPTALIGPVTFFSFYQSPDDYNSRVLSGSFYRIVRSLSLLLAIYLPAIYIAIVSFHSELLPLELANKVKMDINQIPYRPFFEALIIQLTLELIREASVRLPKSVGQTVGIVGGLVIGDAIVSAGLVSNLVVIVVAFTAIASFVVPSVEFNNSIRVLGFPFMILASFFGFFGIVIGSFVVFIHLLNLSSLTQPYLSPVVPFDPKEFKKVFLRQPHYRANKQVTSFSPKKDDKS